MPSIRASLFAAPLILAACGSNPPAESGAAATPRPDATADAAPVPLGRPSRPPGRPAESPDGAAVAPPELPAKVVPNSLLEAQRLTGTLAVEPDAPERAAIEKLGKKVVAVYRMCLESTGAVVWIDLIKSSGFPAYDTKLLRAMKTWTYRPILVDGNPLDVCAPVTFTYPPAPPKTPAPAPAPAPMPAPTPPPR